MSEYHEAKGASLKELREKKRKENLHHLTVHAHRDATPEHPMWIVGHHTSEEDSNPTEREFSSGHEMLAHIANQASVPEEEGE